MKITKTTLLASMLMLTFVSVPVDMSAQKFLNKLKDKVKNITGDSQEQTDTITATRTIDFSKAPIYEVVTVCKVDAKGNKMLNADGTQMVEYRLRDQFGNYASEETVKAQHAAIKKSGNEVMKKIGITTIVSVIDGLKNGTLLQSAIVGSVAGVAISASDLKAIYEQKKSLKQQNKLLAAYSKTFTSEGTVKDASVDLTNVEGIDFTKGEPITMKESELKKIIESEAFNSTDTSAWDI